MKCRCDSDELQCLLLALTGLKRVMQPPRLRSLIDLDPSGTMSCMTLPDTVKIINRSLDMIV